MATNARNTRSTSSARRTGTSTRTSSTARSTSTARTAAQRNEASQVREGVTKARNGAVAIAKQTAERAVDLPVGAALTARDRVVETVESLSTTAKRDKELKSLRTQVTRELNKFERRGGQARRKATQRVRTTRNRVEREAKARRREVEKTVKQNRTKAESQLKKAQDVVSQRISVLS
jgi:hypothetical protein